MCSCGEEPTTSRQSWPIAKREHKCCECGGVIRAGEKYQYLFGVWDGDARTYKTCNDCLILADWAEGDGEMCYTLGDLHQCVTDHVYDSGDDALIAEAKQRIQTIRTTRRAPVAA